MSKVNLKKASMFYLIGNFFNKGIAFFTVPIFTRILSTSDYGVVTTYNSWVTILSMVMGFAIYMGIRASFIDYRENIDDIMSVATTFTIVTGALMAIIVGGCALLLKVNMGFTLIALCMMHGLATALIQNYLMYLMMQYRYKSRTALMILPNLISVIFSVCAILFVVKSHLYMGRVVPTALVNAGFAAITVVLVYSKSHMLYNKRYLKFMMAVSAPLVLHGIALNILSQSDRTMITLLRNSSETGIYSLIYNFSMLATVITTALSGVWVPWFNDNLKKRNLRSINFMSTNYIKFMTFAMVALVLVGPEIVKILADSKYWEGIKIIPPVVLANYLIFAYTMYVNIEHYYKKTIYITINTLIAACINLVLNYIFIPKFGYVAASYTTLAAYLISFVLHARYAKKLEPELYPLKYFAVPLLQILGSVVIFYLLIDNGIARWAVVAVYTAITVFINRKVINELLLKRKKKQV